mgnify:CR=1 FL=1
MTKTLFFSFLLLFMTQAVLGNGVGSTMDEILESEFAQFFNIEQKTETALPFGQKQRHYKTGGFKEHIDLYFIIDKNEVLLTARIEVTLKFITEQTPFAKDVIKSFVSGFCHQKDRAVCQTLSDQIYTGEGGISDDLGELLRVLSNERKDGTSTLKGCVMTLENTKKTLNFEYHFINWEKQKVPTTAFLTKGNLNKYKLECTENALFFNTWELKENKKSNYKKVIDFRFLMDSEEHATNYYRAYTLQQAEGALAIELDKKIGDERKLFLFNAETNETIALLGAKNNYYYFWVRKGKYLAKIFVSVSPEVKLEKVVKLVEKAVKNLR